MMKDETRWKVIVGVGLVTLSILIYAAHYLIFQDDHHLFIFFIGDLAFIPIEVLIVTLIIDQLLAAREKRQRLEKLNMVIGMFFSSVGTTLLATLSRADPEIASVQPHLVVGDSWQASQYHDVQVCLDGHRCHIDPGSVDLDALKNGLLLHEDLRRITERDYSRPVFSEPDLKFSLHPARATTTLSGVS